jgi:3-isopropylmalate/(R)-2-methylmalate dehydratase large subunit
VASVDLAFVQDGTGPLAIGQFEASGFQQLAQPEATVVFLDHAAPSPARELSNDHALLRSFAKETGAVLSDVGDGVCHQIVAEKYANPGTVIVGADSHSVTAGGLGAFATGMGSSDIAVAMALGKTWFRIPESFRILLRGKFRPGVGAKDLILHLIGMIGADGATYKALEFDGDAIDNMSISERLTVANMAVEAGAKVGLFPSDEITREYLAKQDRRDKYRPFKADPDATYERTIEIDISALEPMVSKPHAVDNVALARELEGTKIHQVFLGTCTNGRMEDLEVAATILKGRRRHPDIRLIIAPASRDVMKAATDAGYVKIFLEAGATIVPPGCAACVGVHQGILGDGEACLSTANRNFQGRMGNPEGFIYLASPATAVATAIEGELCNTLFDRS